MNFASAQDPIGKLLMFHLSEYIIDIIENHINKDLPISIQTPTTWSKAPLKIMPQEEEFYDEIFFKMLNDVNVTYVTLGYVDMFKTIAQQEIKPGSNVLFVSGQTLKEIMNVTLNMLQRILHNSRNYAAPTIIALLEPQKYVEEIGDFTSSLLQLSFYNTNFENAVIISQIITYTPYSNQYVIRYFTVGWLPEDQENICSRFINKPKILSMWTSENLKYSVKEIFPKKILRDMKGCTLRIETSQIAPYVLKEGDHIAGFFPSLLRVVANKMNFRVTDYEPYAQVRIPRIYAIPYEACTLTYPYIREDFTWYVPSGLPIPPWQNIIRIFTPDMWMWIGCMFSLATLTFWLLAIFYSRFMNTQMETNLFVIMMNSLLSQLGMGIQDKFKCISAVGFFVMWLMYCLQIYTLFQSTLIGFLLKPNLHPPIRTLKELEESGLRMISRVKFTNTRNINYSRIGEDFANIDWSKFNDRNVAFFDLVFNEKLLLYIRNYMGVKNEKVPLEEIIQTVYMGISTSKMGCLLLESLDALQHRLYASGIMEQWIKEMTLTIWRIEFRNWKSHDSISLSLLHLQGIFYLLFIGLLLACIAFLFEISIPFIRKRRNPCKNSLK